jgi:superfamily I DNA/RNA helicase
VKCRVQGRDLAEGLKSLVRKLKARSVEDLLTKVGDWEKRQIGLLTAAEEEHKIEAVMDKANTLRIIATSSGATTIEGIEAEIESLFSGDGPCVLLSTIHRVKGLESDRVFVIDNDHTPRWAANSPEQMQQELNIKYVAITRAKQELVFVTTAPSKNKNDLKAQVLGAKVESMVGATYLSAISAAPDNAPEQVMNAADEQLLAVHDRK